MPLFDRFRALPGKVRDKAEDAATRVLERAQEKVRSLAPTPPTPAPSGPTPAPAAPASAPLPPAGAPPPAAAPTMALRPEGWPADGWDERGWIHYNIGDKVEFSSADGSGVVHAISSQKPQDDKKPYKAPPESEMTDGTVGVVVGLRKAQDPIVLADGAQKAFGYRRQDVVNLTLEKDRRWARRAGLVEDDVTHRGRTVGAGMTRPEGAARAARPTPRKAQRAWRGWKRHSIANLVRIYELEFKLARVQQEIARGRGFDSLSLRLKTAVLDWEHELQRALELEARVLREAFQHWLTAHARSIQETSEETLTSDAAMDELLRRSAEAVGVQEALRALQGEPSIDLFHYALTTLHHNGEMVDNVYEGDGRAELDRLSEGPLPQWEVDVDRLLDTRDARKVVIAARDHGREAEEAALRAWETFEGPAAWHLGDRQETQQVADVTLHPFAQPLGGKLLAVQGAKLVGYLQWWYPLYTGTVVDGAPPYVFAMWVAPTHRKGALMPALIEWYRANVDTTVVMTGPFSPAGKAAAERYADQVWASDKAYQRSVGGSDRATKKGARGRAAERRFAAEREDLVEWILSDLAVIDLGKGPNGQGWLVYSEKPYMGRIYTQDPSAVALAWVDANYDVDTGTALTPREIRAVSDEGRIALLRGGEPYGGSDLAKATGALMRAAAKAGGMLWIEDAVKQAWVGSTAAPTAPVAPSPVPVTAAGGALGAARAGLGRVAGREPVAALASVRVVVRDPEGAFAAARPSFSGAELPPMARQACLDAAHVAAVEDVFVVERRAGEVVLDVRGPRAVTPQALAARLFD